MSYLLPAPEALKWWRAEGSKMSIVELYEACHLEPDYEAAHDEAMKNQRVPLSPDEARRIVDAALGSLPNE